MKKTTISLLTTALILFCSGILLATFASLHAKISKIEVFDVETKESKIETLSLSIDDVLKNSPESNYVKKQSSTKYTRIDLTSFVGDVIICTGGQETEIVLEETNTNNLECFVEGDALTIREVDPVGFMGFYVDDSGVTFRGLRHTFHPGNAVNSDKIITVKIPDGLTLNQIDVFATIGNITIDGISADTVNAESGKGLISIKNLKNSESKISVKGNFTNIEMEENQYSNCAISTRFGKINASLLEDAKASTILDLWYGSINVETLLPTSEYKLSITTGNGVVKRNSETIGDTLNHDGTSPARISSSIVIGDFNLIYSGEKADNFVPSFEVPEPSDTVETIEEETETNSLAQN